MKTPTTQNPPVAPKPAPPSLGCLLLATALVGLPPATSRAEEVTETFTQSYTLTAGGTVGLGNANGSARFVAAPEGSQELRVEGTKRGKTEEDLRRMTIEVDARPDAVRVVTRYAKEEDGSSRPSGRGRVDYTFTVPRGTRLQDVALTNGSLTLESLTTAGVEASCVNGQLLVRDLAAAGPVTLGGVNGSMEISLGALPADGRAVEIKNVNGSVRVALPNGAGVDLTAKTVNGRIENDAGLAERGESLVGRALNGRIGDGGTPLRLSTVNGSIRVVTKP